MFSFSRSSHFLFSAPPPPFNRAPCFTDGAAVAVRGATGRWRGEADFPPFKGVFRVIVSHCQSKSGFASRATSKIANRASRSAFRPRRQDPNICAVHVGQHEGEGRIFAGFSRESGPVHSCPGLGCAARALSRDLPPAGQSADRYHDCQVLVRWM